MAETKVGGERFGLALDKCETYCYRDYINVVPFLYKRKYREEWELVMPDGSMVASDSIDAIVTVMNMVWISVSVSSALNEKLTRLRFPKQSQPQPVANQNRESETTEQPAELPE